MQVDQVKLLPFQNNRLRGKKDLAMTSDSNLRFNDFKSILGKEIRAADHTVAQGVPLRTDPNLNAKMRNRDIFFPFSLIFLFLKSLSSA